MYTETTNLLKVSVIPKFLDELSSPAEGSYVWAYNVFVENYGASTIQLLSRYWRIIDSSGQVQEVRGEGVVGQQPVLRPKEAFEYTSHARLRTSSGVMMGTYQVISQDTGEKFDVVIPAFSLDSPHETMKFN